ncbi:RICIN domain-containing protein [Dactylosporangium sp. CA-092794]|uniref:RICIN domain-containing protein n=1 Tax=Dactylosporangium sp. CA-092794 TaxID=3239929 RepID=UPI003D8D5D55
MLRIRGKRLTAALIAAATAAAVAVLAWPSTASAAASDTWQIFNYYSGSCLHPQSHDVRPGTQVEQETCQGARVTDQMWHFEPLSGGYYHIRNHGNVVQNVCLNVSGAVDTDRAKVKLWQCGAAPEHNDEWLPDLVARRDNLDWYMLINRDNGKCLNVEGASTADGADLIQYTCDRNAQNEWFSWVLH